MNYVKKNPSKTIAIIDPKTGYPKFILKYDKGQVKLYDNEDTISKFYDYRAKPEGGSIPKEFYIPGKVDGIRLQNKQVDINFERLPEDVIGIINIEYDNDDDHDKGGEKIFRKKSKSKDEIEEEEKIHFPYSGKPKDDDDDDKGTKIERPTRKTSDEYRLEMTLLKSEKEQLMKEVENIKVKFQD